MKNCDLGLENAALGLRPRAAFSRPRSQFFTIRTPSRQITYMSYLKNWRPLTLLNVDYEIATKALALRLRKVLPQVINNAQTGYIEGRFIGQNIRQISDILSFAAEQNIEGIAAFIDFEKASDSLEWKVLLKTIETLNFGSDFKRWIKVLYNNISKRFFVSFFQFTPRCQTRLPAFWDAFYTCCRNIIMCNQVRKID